MIIIKTEQNKIRAWPWQKVFRLSNFSAWRSLSASHWLWQSLCECLTSADEVSFKLAPVCLQIWMPQSCPTEFYSATGKQWRPSTVWKPVIQKNRAAEGISGHAHWQGDPGLGPPGKQWSKQHGNGAAGTIPEKYLHLQGTETENQKHRKALQDPLPCTDLCHYSTERFFHCAQYF